MIEFIGLGPGDPELITLRGSRLLAAAELVIYPGSLLNPAWLKHFPAGAARYDSAALTLEEILDHLVRAHREGRRAVRLLSGDPSLYGAVREQTAALEAVGIPYRVTPGVSSFQAAAARLGREYTIPTVSQTVILTRLGGRTPVPETESLERLSRIRSSLAIFLSVDRLPQVVTELLIGYPPETPAAVVEKVSWPEERVLTGRLDEIAALAQTAGITRTALILVGDFLGAEGHRSELYSPDFRHGARP